MKKRIFIIITLGFIIGCSSENISQNPEDDNNGNGNNGTTASAKTDDPKDLYIVNLAMAEKGETARITRNKEISFRGNSNYYGVVGDKKMIHFFGANYNTDGSVPLTEEDQPEADSKYSVRNNLGGSMVFTDQNDPKANMIVRVVEAFSFARKGLNVHRNITRSITGGKIVLMPIAGKEASFPLPYNVTLTDSALDTKNYGNLNIADNPETQIGMTLVELEEILKTPGDYPVIGFEFSIDDDNKGGRNNPSPKLIVPNFD